LKQKNVHHLTCSSQRNLSGENALSACKTQKMEIFKEVRTRNLEFICEE
jgi:hypothetical protein